MKIAYLAVPFTHADPEVRERRYRDSVEAAVWLLNHGYYVYSPITHSVPIATKAEAPHDFQFWALFDYTMIERMDWLVVLCSDGWMESKGVTAEIKYALAQHKQVMYLVKEYYNRYRLSSVPY